MRIAIIPARAGSKRLPQKNKKLCANKPLIAWSIEAALDAQGIDRVVVSTDDSDILKIAEDYGVIAHQRPDDLAGDSVTMLPVLEDVLAAFPEAKDVVLLQPTSPLRNGGDISSALALYQEQNADSVVSITACPHQFHPDKLLKKNAEGALEAFHENAPTPGNTPDKLAPAYGRNGPAIVISKVSNIHAKNLYGARSLGFEMPPERSIDIDEQWQFDYAEFALSRLPEINRQKEVSSS